MQAHRDYYKVMGLTPLCEQQDIKRAYKELAKKYHPDLNPGKAEEAHKKMKELSDAHDVLSNFERRKEYDQSSIFTFKIPENLQKMSIDKTKKKKKEPGFLDKIISMFSGGGAKKEKVELTREGASRFSMALTVLSQLKKNTLDMAKLDFEEILTESPANPYALYNLAIIEYKLGRYGRALDHLEKAKENMPEEKDLKDFITLLS
ncbi:MAG: DnaJ domain-containing protein [Vulcanimicrobiota bacterium]